MRVATNRKKQIKEKCSRKGCDKPAKKEQKYCSKECSPYGTMVDTPDMYKKFGFRYEG